MEESVFDSLRATEEGEDVHIGLEDMKQLVDVLGSVAALLRDGTLWFNQPGEKNQKHADFCERMARKFANIKIQQEI